MVTRVSREPRVRKHVFPIITVIVMSHRMPHESVVKSATHRWPPIIALAHGAGIELDRWPFRKHRFSLHLFLRVEKPEIIIMPNTSDNHPPSPRQQQQQQRRDQYHDVMCDDAVSVRHFVSGSLITDDVTLNSRMYRPHHETQLSLRD